MQILKKLTLLILTSNLLLLNSNLYAQIATDGTVGPPAKPLMGPNFEIKPELGTQMGGNLFHSFEVFNLKANESATFSGPDSVQNILARVTGGSGSSIDGTLRSVIPYANLWLLNPKGFIFGENYKLNMNQGSFYASTAEGIKLGEGEEVFRATDKKPVLSAAPPSAFGFLPPPSVDGLRPTIDIQAGTQAGIFEIRNSTFYAPNGIINVTKSNGELQITDSRFFAPHGEVNITANDGLKISQTSWKEPSDDPLQNNPLYNPKVDYKHNGELNDVANVDVSGSSGGRIFIRAASHFILDRAWIYADNWGDEQALGIDIAGGDIHLINGARITADNVASGHGGNLSISASSLQLSGRDETKRVDKPQDLLSTIATNNYGPEGTAGGNIQIGSSQAPVGLLKISPGFIQTGTGPLQPDTEDSGAAGKTTIIADKVILEEGRIAANTAGTGKGGIIKITAKDISLNNSRITAQTETSSGTGGDIVIETEKLNLANNGTIDSLSETGTGDAGSIRITADIVNISTDRNVPISNKDTLDDYVSAIAVLAKGARGGNINMEVRDSLSLVHSKITARSTGPNSSDNGGNIWINRPPFSKLKGFTLDDGYLLANANAGDGGNIGIWLEKLTPLGNNVITVSSRLGLYGDFWLNSVKLREPIPPLPGGPPTVKPFSFNRCAFSKDSRFIITARDILPRCPEDLRTQTIRLWR